VLFRSWETFYVIVGSAAGALTGLMFVVMTLVSDHRGSAQQLNAFGTPTVVHFGNVLLVSAIMAAPWPSAAAARVPLLLFGVFGVGYMLVVLRRTRRQPDYHPVLEDWLCHAVLPLAAYAAIAAAATALPGRQVPALFAIGGSAVLLLFVGLHNSWDTVTYVLVRRWEQRDHHETAPRTDTSASGDP
jgi:hypothetical protein